MTTAHAAEQTGGVIWTMSPYSTPTYTGALYSNPFPTFVKAASR